MSRLEVGIQLHLPAHPALTLPDLVRLGRRAEDTGVDQVWVTDNLGSRHLFVTLAALAANVPLKLGAAVLVQAFRSPLETAGALASISELMDGRELTIGIGIGQPITRTLLAVDKPIGVFRETADSLRRLLAGEKVDVAAYDELRRYFNLVPGEVALGFAPRGPIPLYCGANGPLGLAVGGAHCDGLIVGPRFLLLASAGRLQGVLDTFDAAARAAGRASSLPRVAELKLSVARDRGAARDFIRSRAGRLVAKESGRGFRDADFAAAGIDPDVVRRLVYGGPATDSGKGSRPPVSDAMIDASYVAGDPDHCHGRLREVWTLARDKGFHQVILSELGPDPFEALALLRDGVLPAD
jgi:alkanesulfonate monooxygenase SsuD/methylene tetrahydromethanopterin reductase-like flavin-dependent oxidoreductase (luciferase family)